jgi:hypothetical protein
MNANLVKPGWSCRKLVHTDNKHILNPGPH